MQNENLEESCIFDPLEEPEFSRKKHSHPEITCFL